MNDKTRVLILKSYIKGIYFDLKGRIVKCPECNYTIKYIEECFERLNELEELIK